MISIRVFSSIRAVVSREPTKAHIIIVLVVAQKRIRMHLYPIDLLITVLRVAAVVASVFCICVVNWNSFEGIFYTLLNITIGVSLVIMLTVTMLLNRLPQAIETLPFKVRTDPALCVIPITIWE